MTLCLTTQTKGRVDNMSDVLGNEKEVLVDPKESTLTELTDQEVMERLAEVNEVLVRTLKGFVEVHNQFKRQPGMSSGYAKGMSVGIGILAKKAAEALNEVGMIEG